MRTAGVRARQACPVMRSPLPTTSARSWEIDRLMMIQPTGLSTGHPDALSGFRVRISVTEMSWIWLLGNRYPRIPNFDDERTAAPEAL
jgi:hypothetical protein